MNLKISFVFILNQWIHTNLILTPNVSYPSIISKASARVGFELWEMNGTFPISNLSDVEKMSCFADNYKVN